MTKLEFEHLIERPISAEEFRKIQLVYMNTEAIVTPSQMRSEERRVGKEC